MQTETMLTDMTIRLLNPTEEDYPYNLLLLADPSREALADYLPRGNVFICVSQGHTVGVYVLLHTRPFTAEIVNIAVAEAHQRQGIGTRLIQHAIATARMQGFKTLEIGTGNCGASQLMLYQRCGFTITSVDHDFFRLHYPERIMENGMECRHMVRLRMTLL